MTLNGVKIYLAGPMSGYFDFNHKAFNAAASDLTSRGAMVVNPASLDAIHGALRTYADYYRRDIPYLATCEIVALLPGWESSKGANLEAVCASTFGMGVFEYRGPAKDLRLLRPEELPTIVNPFQAPLIRGAD